MKDFMGLCVHTIGFKPELYQPVCQMVRDYHNLDWDIGANPATPTNFPRGEASKANWLDWGTMYGSWVKAGNRIDVCVQWGQNLAPQKWTDMPKQAYAYGKSFADAFGSKGLNLVEAVEIGNEPGTHYDDKAFHTIFKNMAQGLRDGDPKLKIATPTVNIKGDSYSKPLAPFVAVKDLFDVINVHQYAMKGGWPNWDRSFPEDPKIQYLNLMQSVIDYRNANLPGKEVWLTEFGYDASTKQAPETGDFAKWVDVTDRVQARYIVRSFLVFSALDLDRAYLYFYDDKDEPGFHAASGITRNYVPKPSYYAMRHLYQTLGNYRFAKAVTQQPGKLYVYEYLSGSDPKDAVYVAWSPSDTYLRTDLTIDLPAKPTSAQRMPMSDDKPAAVPVDGYKDGKLKLAIDGSPLYMKVRLP
jgi:serine/threonine-protein kinase ATR